MKNLSFVLWLLLWPLLSELTSLFTAKVESIRGITTKRHKESTEEMCALLEFVIWILVAAAVYER